MSAYTFQREGGEWSHAAWRALDRAVYRWVRLHGGDALLAATAAWTSLADGNGDSALSLAGDNRHGMPTLAAGDIDRLRTDALVARAPAADPRPFVLDAANRFYLWRNYVQERDAADLILSRQAQTPTPAASDGNVDENDLDALFHGERGAAVEAQRQAVRGAIGRRLFVLTGGPGTGKTSTVLRMLLMLQRRAPAPLSIRIAAPTGKAAQRLVQALRSGKTSLRSHAAAPLSAQWHPLLDAIPDADALTMHRLLGYQPWRNAFRRGVHDPIAADVVVVDEASMIDLAMLRTLLAAVKPDATLILVGDADQLTSVATGSVLMDIVAALESRAAGDVVRLRHSFRAEQQLVAFNDAVRTGDGDAMRAAIAASAGAVVVREVAMPGQVGESLLRWARAIAGTAELRPVLHALRHESDPRSAAADADGNPSAAATCALQVRGALTALARRQLLCALREGTFGAQLANAVVERALRKAWNAGADAEWYPGRAIIVTRNDYAAGLYNGDIGLCLADDAGNLRVWFEAARGDSTGASSGGVRSFPPNTLPVHESAFAITIHKSQGSEYRHVAILLPPEDDNRILSRQLLYTAVSRARESVELWTSAASLRAALDRPIERKGGLRERLLG